MATDTLTERLNRVADEVETKLVAEKKLKKEDKTPPGNTATGALKRVEKAAKKL